MAGENARIEIAQDLMPSTKLIFPLFNKILILRDEMDEKIGSLWVPDIARDREKPLSGTVVATGPSAIQLKVYDKVVFGQYSGTQIRVDGSVYVVMKEEDVHVTLEERESAREEES